MAQDYYEILGVERKADADEIRKTYRRLARKHHPDLNPGDKSAEERFKKVQEAYDVLSDPKKKTMYDQVGFYSENGMPAGGDPRQGAGMGFGGFDFSDLFAGGAGAAGGRRAGQQQQQEQGNFSDIFSQMFGRGGRSGAPASAPAKGADLEYGLSIDFWQAIRGTQVKLNIARQEVCAGCNGSGTLGGNSPMCPECNGTGNVTQMAGAMKFSLTCPKCDGAGRLKNRCGVCHGDGRVANAEAVEVRIPPGAQQGRRPGRARQLYHPGGDQGRWARCRQRGDRRDDPG